MNSNNLKEMIADAIEKEKKHESERGKRELIRAYRMVIEDIKANHEPQRGTTLGWMMSTLSALERELEAERGNKNR